jgi:2-polyprenyl-3-methyl-5-hydroxy-6-metoxy-1,4-benzoquinol methylase/glycosyltransferase involved in cell wall biosynthesis
MNYKPLMIAMHCGGMPFNGKTIPSGKSLGGSESAAYFMAKELTELGHKVVLFTALPEPGTFDGVIYDHIGNVTEQTPLGDRWHYAMKVPWDVVVIQRHPVAFAQPVNSKVSIWWLHDLALHRFAPLVDKQMPFIDQIFTVSEFHRNQVATVYGIYQAFITATWNGVDYSLSEPLRQNPPNRDRKSLVFASRPERGMNELVGAGGIMEKLTDYTLHVCGYDNTTREMASLYQYLWGRCDELPNVKNHGPLGKKDLYELLSRCGACIYPTNFEDTSNILLMESNAVGTPFIGPSDHAALPETSKGAGFVGVPLKDGTVDREAFAQAARALLENDHKWETAHRHALKKRQTWRSAAEQWTEEIYRILSEKSSNVYRLTKHFERMSDIESIMRLHKGNISSVEKILPDFTANYDFFLNNTFREHYDAYYEYEENRGINYGPESLHGNSRFEHLSNIVKEINPRTILDYGCAHGHVSMNLLEKFPEIFITGVDINQKNIDKARAWADKDNPPVMPEFICGEVDALPANIKFDCIIASEMIEHVKDPVAMVEQLKAYLAFDGWIVFTTPYGPWEAIGYKEHRGWRSHLHHFERWDIHDMFHNQPTFKVLAIPHPTHFGFGHYLFYFKAGGPPCGQIDYERKLATQAPQETVSLCMIAKDAEHTLGQTLQKIESLADEIHIVIDEDTKDDTSEVAAQAGAKVSWGKSPLTVGFAAARNESLKEASCDWVLWIDADEHFERPENVLKYLRRSPIMGFGIPQHHFSEEPPGILKTDFPCRLFRNHRGVKFFGRVHEHPELKMNEGVGKVSILNDFGIMHFGYATENTRRERFKRNWPMMVQDTIDHPERTLGQFLWMRDLMHVCKYTIEQNLGRPTPEIRGYAEKALEMWDKVLNARNLRMIADGLPYYSEAVSYLTNGNGIEYEAELKIRKGALVPTIPKLRGYFLNADHVKKFSAIVHEESVKIYDERYF